MLYMKRASRSLRGARFSSWAPFLAWVSLLLPGLAGIASPASAVAADALQEVIDLDRAGARQLALQALDDGQPAAAEDMAGWMRWERQRIFIEEKAGNWRRVIERLQALPAGISDDFRRWSQYKRAQGFLQTGDGAAARRELRGLIWDAHAAVKEEEFAQWRRMVIRSYLLEGKARDAHAAMLRYRQDYGDAGEDWRLLRARVLLRSGRADDAAQLLAGKLSAEGRPLRMLASLLAGKIPPDQVRGQAARQAANAKLPDRTRIELWLTAAHAARLQNREDLRITAMEQALALGRTPADSLFPIDADLLWAAYRDYGRRLGNEMLLLIGNDEDWYQAGSRLFDKEPVKARALFAVLALGGREEAHRQAAHGLLGELLMKLPHGERVVEELYLNSTSSPEPAAMPENIRQILVDRLLARGEVSRASKLMAGLTRPPEGADPLAWYMRRARVLILGGDTEAGSRALGDLLDRFSQLSPDQVDRLMQVVFDLQTVGANEAALLHLRRIQALPLDDKQRREIPFWMGDSLKALGRYKEAALHYLRSAMHPDPFAMDPWAQTARYQAAEALARAGYKDDARRMLRKLLNATRDPARQAVLRQKLQRLLAERGEPADGGGAGP